MEVKETVTAASKELKTMHWIIKNVLFRPALACVLLFGIACDGGSSETPSTANGGGSGGTPDVGSGSANFPADDKSAARLLAQATFGTTLEDIAEVKSRGIAGWLEHQFTLEGTSHLQYSNENDGSGSNSEVRMNKWWLDAVDAEDQLRARVAFALSEIFVVSNVQQTLGYAEIGLTNYYDMLRGHAFGDFRQLLTDVTLSPVMGVYLSMMQNAKADQATNTRADENFAREVMQLFTIGLHELNIDGTPLLVDGNPVPTYTQADVSEYARVFTGWGYAVSNRWNALPDSQYSNFLLPMVPFPEYHDTGQKRLLRGVVSPAGLSAEEDVKIALDSLFDHPNVGPFIAKQLIQRLITSNPSTGYVARVATKFNDNGSGVRGDLKAVVRAIFLDEEARYGHTTIADFGKLREPVIRLSHLWRAFNAQYVDGFSIYSTNSPQLKDTSPVIGQQALGANSVFNFFHPDYAPLGPIRDKGLLAPESEIYTENYILSTTTYLNTYIHKFYDAGPGAGGVQFNTYIDIKPQVALAENPDAFLDEIDLVLLSGQMSSEMRTILKAHMSTLPDTAEGKAQRVLDVIGLTMASPAYLVQK